jgi:SAM-dependent methyltransferase
MPDINFQEESKKYEKSLTSEYKKKNGIYYTEVSLIKNIYSLLNIDENKDLRIIDPTCGTGSFLSVASELGYTNLYGMDIDNGAIKVAKKLVPEVQFKTYDSISNSYSKVLKAFKIKEKFHVVIGNPPYAPLSTTQSNDAFDYLFYRTVKNNGDNLYIAALLRAKEMVSEGGLISFIIPKNFLHVNSYSLLRRELLRDFTIESIVDIGVYFKNVRGEQIILNVRKLRPHDNQIKMYKLIDNDFEFLTEIAQDFYKDTIILFESKTDHNIYIKFSNSYTTLNDYVNGYVGRGRAKGEKVISGKDIRKFGLKDNRSLTEGNKIFIQNIYSKESGIIACFGGDLDASETVTIFTDGDATMCRYVLGVIHSRLINYFLHRYCFNKSQLTMHVDAKYLRKIPFIVSDALFDIVLDYVDLLEKTEYMSDMWHFYFEQLNDMIYKIYDIDSEEKEYIEETVKIEQSKKWVMSNGKES